MIPSKYAHKVFSALAGICLIAACQDRVEQPPDVVRPVAPHQSLEEKPVVVPPEVAGAWKEVKIGVFDKARATQNVYTVPVGGSYRVPASNTTISADYFLPAFFMEGSVITSSSNKLTNPGARVTVSDNDTIVFKGWLFQNYRNSRAFMHPKFGFALVEALPKVK